MHQKHRLPLHTSTNPPRHEGALQEMQWNVTSLHSRIRFVVHLLALSNTPVGLKLQWKNPNEGLQLNPPRVRPVSSKALTADDSKLDWRSYRAKLVMMDRSGLLAPGCSSPVPYAFSSSTWAHELPAPEVGCLLVARQQGMEFFDKSVVLLAAHGECQGNVTSTG